MNSPGHFLGVSNSWIPAWCEPFVLFRWALSILLVLSVCGRASATSYILPTLVEECEDADLIVVGAVEKTASGHAVKVSRWLKGKGSQTLEVEISMDPWAPNMKFDPSWDLLLFLRNQDGKLHLSVVGGIKLLQLQSVESRTVEILAMKEDPLSFLRKGQLNADFAELLGRWFEGRVFSFPSSEGLAQTLERSYPPARDDLWLPEEVVFAKCLAPKNPDEKFEVLSIEPPGKVADYLKKLLVWAGRYRDVPRRTEFAVTFDTRLPKESRGVRNSQAIEYLHRCAQSEDIDVARAAIKSLSLLRDRSAVPMLLKRLEMRDKVGRDIVDFLGQSADPRAVDSLCAILWRRYPEESDLADFNAAGGWDIHSRVEFALKTIGDPKAGPALEYSKKVEQASLARLIFENAQLGEDVPESMELETFESLLKLVRTSNCREEEWMKEIGNAKNRAELRNKWLSWWSANKKTIRVVKE